MYIDGKKVAENHSLDWSEILELAGVKFTTEWEDPKTEWDDMQDWFFVEELSDEDQRTTQSSTG